MSFDRFLIAPLNSGLVRNSPTWLQPDDAFEFLQNAYVFRQRVKKRFGSKLMGTSQFTSRLRMSLTPGGLTVNTPSNVAIGQQFSIGTDIFTVTDITPPYPINLLSTSAVTAQLTAANLVTFSAIAGTVYWYPSLPVMGIDQYSINEVNNHPTFAFDTQFAYRFSGGAWTRSGAAVWHGGDLNYFWVCNWQSIAGTKVMFVTNFNAQLGNPKPTAADDPIWTFDGTTWTAHPGSDTTNGIFFLPSGLAKGTGPFVQTALIIVAFKNRLLLLNTVENNNSSTTGTGTAVAYPNRCRYSINGSPFARNAWYEPNQKDSGVGAVDNNNIAAGAGYIDATTDEAIIGAEFIKDRLIVYFERSTWELAYTQSEILPFVWQKLNTELGSMSTFSTIPFDKDVLAIGQSGVHACSGVNVSRIDQNIPNQVFDFKTENTLAERVCGIRDYYTEMVYWGYVSDDATPYQVWNNKVLVFNYQNRTWAVNDDCITCFGYFEQSSDITWESSAPTTWSQFAGTWSSNVNQANQRQIVMGTPEGFVLQLNVDQMRNAPSMSITNIGPALGGGAVGQFSSPTGILTLTIIDHNLTANPTDNDYDNDFILIENVVADTATQTFLNGTIFQVDSVVDDNTITINTQGGLTSGTYKGGGTAARVSNIQIKSKSYNPYVDKDMNVAISKIDFAVKRTAAGAITVDYYTSNAPISMLDAGVASGAIMGNGILETSPYDPKYYPMEQYQDLLWHPITIQSSGEFIQLIMYFSLDQMLNPTVSLSEFELQAITLYAQPTGRLQ